MLPDKNEPDYIATFEVTEASTTNEEVNLKKTLAEMLGNVGTKGVIVVMPSHTEVTISDDIVTSVRDLLLAAPIPTASVSVSTASGQTEELEKACLFHFTAKASALDETMQKADAYLRELTAKRPRHVIAAVLQSLRNAEILPTEAALLEETKLFCELSHRNRTPDVEAPQ